MTYSTLQKLQTSKCKYCPFTEHGLQMHIMPYLRLSHRFKFTNGLFYLRRCQRSVNQPAFLWTAIRLILKEETSYMKSIMCALGTHCTVWPHCVATYFAAPKEAEGWHHTWHMLFKSVKFLFCVCVCLCACVSCCFTGGSRSVKYNFYIELVIMINWISLKQKH